MKRVLNYILLIIIIWTVYNPIYSQIDESELKAAYIERFTRFVEWPKDKKNNNDKDFFVITVLGKNTFGSALDNLFHKVEIDKRHVLLKYTENYKNIDSSDIIIICNSERKNLSRILSLIGTNPILIISDSEGFAQKGTHINMYLDSNYIRFEINQKAIEKSGLKVSSLLMASAKIVNADE